MRHKNKFSKQEQEFIDNEKQLQNFNKKRKQKGLLECIKKEMKIIDSDMKVGIINQTKINEYSRIPLEPGQEERE